MSTRSQHRLTADLSQAFIAATLLLLFVSGCDKNVSAEKKEPTTYTLLPVFFKDGNQR